MEENTNYQKQEKKSFFSFGKKSQEPEKKAVPQIKITVQVEKTILDFQSILDYANSRFISEDGISEVQVIDRNAAEQVIATINKSVTVNLGEGIEVIYLLDAKPEDKRVVAITCLCVDGFDKTVARELESNNHIIRITK